MRPCERRRARVCGGNETDRQESEGGGRRPFAAEDSIQPPEAAVGIERLSEEHAQADGTAMLSTILAGSEPGGSMRLSSHSPRRAATR